MTEQSDVRAIRESDLPAIAAITQATGLFPAEMLPELVAGALEGTAPDIWLISIDVTGPLGFVYCAPERLTDRTWNLLAIGVIPAAQGQGVGASLLRRLEQKLISDKQRLLLVETLGTPAFARTRAFYRANGFAEEACIRDFYEAGGDKIVFRKALR